MEKEEVVRLFLKNGYQLSKTALSLVLSNPEQIISELKKLKPRPFIVTKKHVKRILKEAKKPIPKVEIFKEYRQLKSPIKIDDYVKHFLTRYEKIKNFISKRMDPEKLISINKIAPQSITFSIIGIVREKGRVNLLIEDPTGEVNIFFGEDMKGKFKDIFLDDVIGIKCKKIKDRYYAKNMVYPDILSSREISKTENDVKVMVISNPFSLDDTKYQKLLSLLSTTGSLSSIFLFENGANKKLEDFSKFTSINISSKSNPTIYRINNIKILALPKHFFKKSIGKISPIAFMVSILKRRYIPTIFDSKPHVRGNNFILDEIPDIIISNFHESVYKNYKGTTIISNSESSKIYLIDLKTREVTEKII